MKKLISAVGIALFTVTLAWASGSWDTPRFRYTPQKTTQGTTDYNQIVISESRTSARLSKTVWVGDPAISAALGVPIVTGITLQDAITACATTATTLHIGRGTYSINADLDVPATIELKPERGAVFAVADGKTLTINGNLSAGKYQIFSCTGTGKVVGSKFITTGYPEWFGCVANDSTTDYAAKFQLAVNMMYQKRLELSGEYYVSSSIVHRCSLVGPGGVTAGITAKSDFSGTILLDLYSTAPYASNSELPTSNVTLNTNHVANVQGLGSSTNGEGGFKSVWINCNFLGVRGNAAAVQANSTTAGTGALTGTTFISCLFADNAHTAWILNNQDEVFFINCRLELTIAPTSSYPLKFGGGHTKFDGGFIQLGTTLYNDGVGSVMASIGAGRNTEFNNVFIEYDGDAAHPSDITNLFYLNNASSPADANLIIKGLKLRLSDASQCPNLTAVVRAVINQYGSTIASVVDMENIYEYTGSPSYKLLDVYVKNVSQNDYVVLNVKGCYNFSPPFFQWAAGSTTVTRDTVYVNGEWKGQAMNFSYNQTLGNSIPNSQTTREGYKGQVTSQGVVVATSAVTPLTQTITLPSNGVWELALTVKQDDSLDHMSNGVYNIYYNNAANDLLVSEQIGTTKSVGNGGALTVGNPNAAGEVIITFVFGGGGSHVGNFYYKLRKKTNFFAYGD